MSDEERASFEKAMMEAHWHPIFNDARQINGWGEYLYHNVISDEDALNHWKTHGRPLEPIPF